VQVVPSGYFVRLNGSQQIGSGATVTSGTATFTELATLGTGTVASGSISGTFVLATNGNVYFVTSATISSNVGVTSGVSGTVFTATVGDNDSDSLGGSAGSDTMYGGAYRTNVANTGSDTIYGYGGNDLVFGGGGNDSLYGGDGNDFLAGGTGNDRLDGGSGSDTLAGGAGNDSFYGGSGLDYFDYRDSTAGVSVNLTTNSFSGGDANGDVNLGGMDAVLGSAFNDTLVGFDDSSSSTSDSYTNVIDAGAGNDYVEGRGGGDLLYGGTGNDTIYGDRPGDTYTESDNDIISGGDGNDAIYGGADADTITGDAGDDTIQGGTGNDSISGGTGADSISGDAGNDTLLGGDGNDTLTTGLGTDSIQGGAGNDTIVIANNSTLPGFSIGGTIDGGTADTDVLDLTAWGFAGTNIIYDPTDPKAGTIQFLDSNGNVIGTMTFSEIEQIITCFTPGSLATTDRGLVAVEDLRVGDRVLTRDSGFQPIVWTGHQQLSELSLLVQPRFRPIRIAAGALRPGVPARDMVVSPQHRVLLSDPRADVLFGESEVLVPAQHLVGRPGIEALGGGAVTYIHFMCATHQIVLVDGCWSESFQPGDQSLAGLADEARAEVLALFPGLNEEQIPTAYPAARPSLKRHEAALLFAG
jgi:Ca2+-binding RTX toxin-like protein